MSRDELVTLYHDIRKLEARAEALSDATEDVTDMDGRSLGRDLQELPVMLSNAADELKGNLRWFYDIDADKQTTKAA